MQQFTNRKISFNALSDFSSISKPVQHHLVHVYSALAATLFCAAIGSVVHLLFNIGGFLTTLGAIGLIVLLAVTPPKPDNHLTRISYLFGIGFLQGCSMGNLIGMVLELDPSILVTAFSGTVAVFACFTASALLAERRSMLFMGGLLSSGLSILCWIGFLNLFFGSTFAFNIQLYLGLLVFSGFVVFDTQLIIEKASAGSRDYVAHSLELFLDFVAIFVRLLIILTRNSKKKSNK